MSLNEQSNEEPGDTGPPVICILHHASPPPTTSIVKQRGEPASGVLSQSSAERFSLFPSVKKYMLINEPLRLTLNGLRTE